MPSVYLLSGPAGVGKSTTSKALARTLKNSAYISGDDVSHMHKNGRRKPWESELELSLIWNNISSLTQNFISNGTDVVIDYVTFPREAYWLKERLKAFSAEVVYTVLWVDAETLLSRDRLRQPEHQMGERCLILIEEFKASGLDTKHLLDTSRNRVDAIELVIQEIVSNERYRLG
ncbi:AAA family ATPase [Cohnella ginsengisoli]|uniref:AAA family ATPase n=1 Tax=Cohnella ginsengisoli TaxID=425004 RepID=A0A9X4QMD4_9BACL|nr:AAA family ATPase [Cohnella ginsengisoli]MDG0791211.1 AAA family ATPase [Cohnella ginsengisoli]